MRPGAFLWLTFAIQGATGTTAPSMWIGIVFALLLCLATAVCYAELAKLYPGTGSSYYFAEQSFLNHEKAWKYARLSKFIVGWGSHLYYWIYPGVMVGVTGVICGYRDRHALAELHERVEPGSDVHDAGRDRVFVRRGLHRASRRQRLDVRQHRDQRDSDHGAAGLRGDGVQLPERPIRRARRAGSSIPRPATLTLTNFRPRRSRPTADHRQIVRDTDGTPKPKLDAAGKPVAFIVQYPENDDKGAFLTHPTASSVVGVHNFAWMFIQATVAILILVGFESVTAMGGEAKNAKRDVPIAVITSLLVQGAFCYLIEYFAANYFLSSGIHHAERHRLRGAHRRHDGDPRQRSSSAQAAAESSCWWKPLPYSWL